jgi:hypothetical protein
VTTVESWVLPALLLLLVLVVLGSWLSWTATRLDRLHARVDTARAVLDSRLLRRSSVALEAAAAGMLDPAASLVVADAAHAARSAPSAGREQAESDLTAALVAAFPDPGVVAELGADEADRRELLSELAGACREVEMARRFHNDSVRAALRLRRRVRVRLFRLAGRTPAPETVEFDDEVPSGLAA